MFFLTKNIYYMFESNFIQTDSNLSILNVLKIHVMFSELYVVDKFSVTNATSSLDLYFLLIITSLQIHWWLIL